MDKHLTANRQFCTMTSVTPLKVSWEIERLSPARPIVSPATAPSRQQGKRPHQSFNYQHHAIIYKNNLFFDCHVKKVS